MKGMLMSVMALSLATVSVSGREPQHFPQEVRWSGKQADMTLRLRLQATVFPEFAIVGSLEEVIEHLRNEFRKHSRNGASLGSFVIADFERLPKRLNIRLRGRNTLEIIDNLCALAGCNWTVAPHAIKIGRTAVTTDTPPKCFPHELPDQSPPGPLQTRLAGLTLREWCVATVFPEFKVSGTLEDAVGLLMTESRKFSPNGMMVGGFTIRSGDIGPSLDQRKLELDLKGKNALEIIDAMCGATQTTWTFTGRILIQDDSKAQPK